MLTQLPLSRRGLGESCDGGRAPSRGIDRPEMPHARNKNEVGMTEQEQQVLAGQLAQLGERTERLAELAEEVASLLGAMTDPASAPPQEPAERAAQAGRPAA